MAEAVVEERPPPQPTFYCHLCSVEIENITPDYTCPLCSGGFIEELPAPADRTSDEDDPTNEYAEISNRLTDEISSLLMSVTGARFEVDEEDGERQTPGGGGTGVPLGRRNRRRYGNHNLNNFSNMLQDFVAAIANSAGGRISGGNSLNTTGAPMWFIGNPADYAWGREGLDAIVTTLLNQLDGSGPPPLTQEKIAEIPNVKVTCDMEKQQCSVCWDDFKLDDTVRQLPCMHIYHENCIVPWLKLHATCPVCRKSLTNENAEEEQRNIDVENTLRNLTTIYSTHPNASPRQFFGPTTSTAPYAEGTDPVNQSGTSNETPITPMSTEAQSSSSQRQDGTSSSGNKHLEFNTDLETD